VSNVLGWIGFLALAVLLTVVAERFGPDAYLRLWGIALMVTALVMSLRRSIPVYLGRELKAELIGWKKAWVVVPAFALGVAVAAYPHFFWCAGSTSQRCDR